LKGDCLQNSVLLLERVTLPSEFKVFSLEGYLYLKGDCLQNSVLLLERVTLPSEFKVFSLEGYLYFYLKGTFTST